MSRSPEDWLTLMLWGLLLMVVLLPIIAIVGTLVLVR